MVSLESIVERALMLLAHVNSAGGLDRNREARYFGMAPAYLTILQNELALLENSPAQPAPVADLRQTLQIDDETALRALPAGLAMYFALADRDDIAYNHFSKLYYGEIVPSVRPDEAPLRDCYGVRADPTMQ